MEEILLDMLSEVEEEDLCAAFHDTDGCYNASCLNCPVNNLVKLRETVEAIKKGYYAGCREEDEVKVVK